MQGRPKCGFKDVPWDCLDIVVDFLPLNLVFGGSHYYKEARLLNRNLYRLINKRRLSLTFRSREITERVFFDLIEKSSRHYNGPGSSNRVGIASLADRPPLVGTFCKIKVLSIKCNIQSLKMTVFNKLVTPLPGLEFIDFQGAHACLGEQGLNRILMGCRSTLRSAKLPYHSQGVGQLTLQTLGTLPKLETLILGNPYDFYKASASRGSKLPYLKQMLRRMAPRIASSEDCKLQ